MRASKKANTQSVRPSFIIQGHQSLLWEHGLIRTVGIENTYLLYTSLGYIGLGSLCRCRTTLRTFLSDLGLVLCGGWPLRGSLELYRFLGGLYNWLSYMFGLGEERILHNLYNGILSA